MIVAELDPRTLLSLKLRLPLCEKCSNSFTAVIGQVATNLFANLVIERLREFLLIAGKKRLLHRADRQRRPFPVSFRKCPHCPFLLPVLNNPICDPHAHPPLTPTPLPVI